MEATGGLYQDSTCIPKPTTKNPYHDHIYTFGVGVLSGVVCFWCLSHMRMKSRVVISTLTVIVTTLTNLFWKSLRWSNFHFPTTYYPPIRGSQEQRKTVGNANASTRYYPEHYNSTSSDTHTPPVDPFVPKPPIEMKKRPGDSTTEPPTNMYYVTPQNSSEINIYDPTTMNTSFYPQQPFVDSSSEFHNREKNSSVDFGGKKKVGNEADRDSDDENSSLDLAGRKKVGHKK